MKRGPEHDQFDKEPLGRIPESLIDAALDGEICDQMQDEIAHALQYDHSRRAELLETADAVRALDLDEIPMPDMQCLVLNRLDHHERFIPKTMRRWVRTGRLAVAAGILLGLMLVAGMQSIYPRLTTLGAQDTPVDDVASALSEDSQRAVADMQNQVEILRASFMPIDRMNRFLAAPQSVSSNSFTLTLNHRVIRFTEADLEALVASGVTIDDGSHVTNMERRLPLVQHVVGGEDCLIVDTEAVATVGGGDVVVQTVRVTREAPSDERIADLP